MREAPDEIYRLRTVEGEIFFFDAVYIHPSKNEDAVRYIRKDIHDRQMKQLRLKYENAKKLLWEYAGVKDE